MNTFEARVYVKNGNAKIAHTVRVQATTVFAAQQQLIGMYGASNVITIPRQVSGGGSSSNSNWTRAPWLK